MKSLPTIFAGLFRDLADWLDATAIQPVECDSPAAPAGTPIVVELPAVVAAPAAPEKPPAALQPIPAGSGRRIRTFKPRQLFDRLYWRARPPKLTLTQWAIVEWLDIHGQIVTVSDIIRGIGVTDRKAINRALNVLANRRIVERTSAPYRGGWRIAEPAVAVDPLQND